MAHYKLILKGKRGNVYTGFIDHVEYGGDAWGIITDNEDNELGSHISSTLDWLEHDLLRIVEFDENVDTYEKIGKVMDDKNLLDKIISLTEEIVKLKIENERLKEKLKHEVELNKFRTEYPNKI